MDIVIMTAAISELINYPAIPVAVTMNEYVEIANTYSSPKSGQFINGILYNVVNLLREEGKTEK
jgi:N utilization substance protein B